MAVIHRLSNLQKELALLQKRAKDDSQEDYLVAYVQTYALAVHERNLNYNNGKQWKYVETPARALQNQFATIIKDRYRKTKSIDAGLKAAANLLFRESQKLVPFDTGALKASGFVATDKTLETLSQIHFEKAQAIRASVTQKRIAKARKKLARNKRRGK